MDGSMYLDIGNLVIILIILGCLFYLYTQLTDMKTNVYKLEDDYNKKYVKIASTTTASTTTTTTTATTIKST